jgi:hypothetical protein
VGILTPSATVCYQTVLVRLSLLILGVYFGKKLCFNSAVHSNTEVLDLQFPEFTVVICRKDKSDLLSVKTPGNIISCLHAILAAKLLLYCRLTCYERRYRF